MPGQTQFIPAARLLPPTRQNLQVRMIIATSLGIAGAIRAPVRVQRRLLIHPRGSWRRNGISDVIGRRAVGACYAVQVRRGEHRRFGAGEPVV
jgi:hypothetical protein